MTLSENMSDRRKTDLREVLFDVQLRPVLVDVSNGTREQGGLFEQLSEIPRYKAIVDTERGTVLCIVTNNYQLVTNKQAIEIGKSYFDEVFSKMTADGMEVFNIITPSTRTFCHIDFIHKERNFEPWAKDKWVPFLRVTNSYNKTKLLRFDLGFCRAICTNGIIFGKRGVTVKVSHTSFGMSQLDKIDLGAGGLKQLEVEFIERLKNLKRFHVPRSAMLPLACKVFEIIAKPDDLNRPKRIIQLGDLNESLGRLTSEYFDTLGENAYAALNVLTDFASRPISYISPVAVIDSLQKKAGDWMDGFIAEIKRDSFTFDDYLKDFKESANIIRNLN